MSWSSHRGAKKKKSILSDRNMITFIFFGVHLHGIPFSIPLLWASVSLGLRWVSLGSIYLLRVFCFVFHPTTGLEDSMHLHLGWWLVYKDLLLPYYMSGCFVSPLLLFLLFLLTFINWWFFPWWYALSLPSPFLPESTLDLLLCLYHEA